MKKQLISLSFFVSLLVLTFSFSACSKKTGCPVNESVHVKTNKKGGFSNKGGKSNLFPKDMRSSKKK